MAAPSAFKRQYSEWSGVDYRSNERTRNSRFARDAKNLEYFTNNSFGNRPGQQSRLQTNGGGGLFNYVYRDSDQNTVEELITIDEELRRKKTGSFTITYSGSGDSVAFICEPYEVSTGVYSIRIRLYVDGTYAYSADALGTGLDVDISVAASRISTIISAIDALSDFACVLDAGDNTTMAYLVPYQTTSVDPSSGATIQFFYWEKVYCPTTTPFSAFWTAKHSENFELASFANPDDILLIATGSNQLYKYDGVSTYLHGMPAATTLAGALNAAGALTGDYVWGITYEQVDARDRSTEGDLSNEVSLTLAGDSGDITIPTLQTSSGFLTSCAIVNGAQVGVTTITVDAAHTIQVGQTAFFRDNAGALQEKVITARTNTTITFAGAVTVADNEVISANLRINLWRNVAGSTIKYLVRTFANDSTVATFVYNDANSDATISANAEYVPPAVGHGRLEDINPQHLAVYQGLVAAADSNDEIFFSDADGPEYFNESYSLRSRVSRRVTGIAASKEALIAFKEEGSETHILVGDLVSGDYRNELLASGEGCAGHASICLPKGNIWYLDGKQGVKRQQGTGVPDAVSYRVEPLFKPVTTSEAQRPSLRRAVQVSVDDQDFVLLFVPCETDTGSLRYPNDNSYTLFGDYSDQEDTDDDFDESGRLLASRPKVRWWPHSSINMAGGAAVHEGQLYYTIKRYSDTLADVEFITAVRLPGEQDYDFTDFSGEIDWYYDAAWEDFGEPEVDKRWLTIPISSFPIGYAASFTALFETFVNWNNSTRHSFKEIEFGEGGAGGGWGSAPWGTFPWGATVTSLIRFKLKPRRARALKLKISGTAWKTLSAISGWTLEAVPTYRKKSKKP